MAAQYAAAELLKLARTTTANLFEALSFDRAWTAERRPGILPCHAHVCLWLRLVRGCGVRVGT